MNAFSSYTNKSADAVLETFRVTRARGRSEEEVETERSRAGWNRVESARLNAGAILLRQFKSSFVYLLFASCLITFALGEFVDGSMILLFVLINATLGFLQEYRSEQTVQLLKKYLASRVRVRRDGKETIVTSDELVPGDIVLLAPGDIIPADVRVLSDRALHVDESILSGESVPVYKRAAAMPHETDQIYNASNIAFAGTTVLEGRAEGIVLATGKRTVAGEIAHLTGEMVRESGVERGIHRFSSFILRLVGVTIVIMFAVNILLDGSRTPIGELFVFCVALAVSVIPEALPTVITFSLSRGAARLARHKVIVKRLSAIEDLGSIEVLCSDKTGTLTENHLTVADIHAHDARRTLYLAACASTNEDPFDIALRDALSRTEKEQARTCSRIEEIPFDPARRRNSVLLSDDGKRLLVVRGAVEAIWMHCSGLSAADRDALRAWMEKEGRQGRRVLAVAYKPYEKETYEMKEEMHGLTWLGCVSFIDPVKPTARESVRKAERLGVRIKILTGDSREVAGAVAYHVGLIDRPDDVMTGEELEALAVEAQHEAVRKTDVFARVSPQQKYNIIQLLQETQEVGFLGEGINDAPALKLSNVGLVVNSAADVAREAADIVLLQKSLHVIVEGVSEGREVFANTVKYIRATLTSNFGNFYALAFATLFIDYLPMLPLQILLLNLLSDFPMIAVATDSVDPDELKKPRVYDVQKIVLTATVLGLVSTVFDFIFFAVFKRYDPSVLQTNWFIGSILTELVLIFSVRTKFLFFRAARPSALLSGLSVAATIVAIVLPLTSFGHSVFRFVTPSITHAFIILGLVIAYFVVTETVKLAYFRVADQAKS